MPRVELALRGKELLQGTQQHSTALAQASVVLMLIDRAEGHARKAAESCMQLYARCARTRRQSDLGDGHHGRGVGSLSSQSIAAGRSAVQ